MDKYTGRATNDSWEAAARSTLARVFPQVNWWGPYPGRVAGTYKLLYITVTRGGRGTDRQFSCYAGLRSSTGMTVPLTSYKATRPDAAVRGAMLEARRALDNIKEDALHIAGSNVVNEASMVAVDIPPLL